MKIRHKLTGTGVDFAFRRTAEITPGFLHSHGIRGLILDVDNTLTTHDHPAPAEGIMEWIDNMKRCGVRMMILSNNVKERVKPFAELLGLPFVSKGAKPLRKGYIRAMKRMQLQPCETAAVGDQLFTDIWGANFAGITSIYVSPIEPEGKKERFIRFKRVLEKPFLPDKFQDDEVI
ncbi:MAG: YqeG family HAD IIIA-type phosphatase [Ruminococcus sp.]|nr:YqeG family HAD IIIA-type phosphatase [Ruminococcus sp.]